jgi:hypothetical protein
MAIFISLLMLALTLLYGLSIWITALLDHALLRLAIGVIDWASGL